MTRRIQFSVYGLTTSFLSLFFNLSSMGFLTDALLGTSSVLPAAAVVVAAAAAASVALLSFRSIQ